MHSRHGTDWPERGRRSVHYFIHTSVSSSIQTFIDQFIHPSSYLWNGFPIFDTGGQQYWFLYPVVPDAKWVPGDWQAAAVAVDADRPAGLSHGHHPEQSPAHLQDVNSSTKSGKSFLRSSNLPNASNVEETHLCGRCGGFWRGASGEEGLPGDGAATTTQQIEEHCRRHGWLSLTAVEETPVQAAGFWNTNEIKCI